MCRDLRGSCLRSGEGFRPFFARDFARTQEGLRVRDVLVDLFDLGLIVPEELSGSFEVGCLLLGLASDVLVRLRQISGGATEARSGRDANVAFLH